MKKNNQGFTLIELLVVIGIIIVLALLSFKSLVFIDHSVSTADSSSSLGVTAVEPQARIATSSTIQVGPQQVKTIFSSKNYCAARIIGTSLVGVTLSFTSTVTPSATVGAPVAASSTTAFIARTYGCGDVTAFATGSTTITITESLF